MRRHGPSVLLVAVSISACVQPNDRAGEAPTATATSSAAPSFWECKLGQLVTVEGEAEDAKLGAMVVSDARSVWIDGLDAWPDGVRGKRVEVTGKVIQRSDLPVFVHQEGEPEMAGMPVPPGTDLEKARRRFLLSEAKWTVLK